jgi:hypothetical protein
MTDSRIIYGMVANTRGVTPPDVQPAPPLGLKAYALEQRHVEGARLYADRECMVRALRPGKGGIIAEVGVALGDFSRFLLDELHPERFHALDLFRMHEEPVIWAQPSKVLFKGMTQLDFYRQRFAAYGDRVQIEVGLSYDMLWLHPDHSFDMIYIDAGHDYESVRRDAIVAARKIKPNGTLIFNDYTMADPVTVSPYGVVQAVNEMIVQGNDGWRVIGFAFQQHMFCNIALRRASTP